ncbi:zinc-ribbon domain-containing protein [Lactobacillus crispatus]|uniref:zinc-ribbon domain-containing protein n=2 Tax=Lactobacillus crispatus TaxID=47770 RepID=UPI0022ABE2F1|nr:zinc-ribbon domain-containing protein [Lactobacillus crispatus]
MTPYDDPKTGNHFDFSWKVTLRQRINNRKCPYIDDLKVYSGFNDLKTRCPRLMKEWDYSKNTLNPSNVLWKTTKKAWWICPFGHSYSSYPYNKTGINHSDCPICDKENHTSFPEQAIYFYIKQEFPDAINSDQNTIGMELDVYVPSIRTAIEYDGFEWHRKHLKRDAKKDNLCRQNNIRLIRIREDGLPALNDSVNIIEKNPEESVSLASSIQEVFKVLNKSNHVKINLGQDASYIYESYIKSRKSKSLLKLFPDIAKEWHPTRNGQLLPSMVSYGTPKKVWWKCPQGHEYQMGVYNRTVLKCNCPICNDLQ